MTKPNFTPDAHSMKLEIERLERKLAESENRVKELERLLKYTEEQQLLPQISFEGARELVSDIQKDATDAGGCYEVSTNLLDQLFERYTDRGACVLLNKFAIEQKKEALNDLLNSGTGYLQTEEGQFAYYDYEIQGRIEQLDEQLSGNSGGLEIEQLRAKLRGNE